MKEEVTSHNLPEMLWLAAGCGLLCGLLESPLLGLQKLLSARALFLGPRVVWMAPLTNLVLFIGAGLLLWLLSRRWARWRTPRTALAVFGFMMVLSWLLIFPRIQWYASTVLAAGMTSQVVRWMSLQQYAPRVTKRCAAIVLLLFMIVEGRMWWNERHALAQLSTAPAAAPNVLLLVMDTVRAQSLSVYGYERQTSPQLERYAARGVRFEHAIATAPWTTPAHASMFTGQLPLESSADWNKPLDERHATLAETLRTRGYATAGFVANTFGCGAETGLNRGFIHYEDYTVSGAEFLLSSSLARAVLLSDDLHRMLGKHEIVARKSAADINRSFLAWQQNNTRPFFAFLNYLDAHEPYLPPAPFAQKFGTLSHTASYRARHDLRTSFRRDREQLPAAETQAEQLAYDSAIAYLDQQIGLLLDELERRGVLQNTLVVITSDHGESFGEHNDFGHGNSLYLPLLHVPLLMIYPARVPEGQRVAATISLRDLPATILELTGMADVTRFSGRSLVCYWRQDARPSASLALSQVNVAPIRPGSYPTGAAAVMHSVLHAQYHYIKNANGQEELYDYWCDPAEATDLKTQSEVYLLLEQLRGLAVQIP